ncbi:MAG TPA: YhbY family RNA-binding protein [Candidatus Bathyarchaeota archaeon]|nr:YhbY family RNA-binding protein [Candidatus Bathyarchaeota archaeon]HEW89734.1 YhbY family RNA-binding protein [Candidatus Bathyarchaeota archaeon]
MVSKRFRRRLASAMSHEKPTVWVGKAGVTEGLVGEVSKQLDAHRAVKVKVQKSALVERTVEDVAAEVAERTGAELIEVRGRTFVLYRRRRRRAGTR